MSKKNTHKLIFEFPSAELRDGFLSWLCNRGEQYYWGAPDERDEPVCGFEYHDEHSCFVTSSSAEEVFVPVDYIYHIDGSEEPIDYKNTKDTNDTGNGTRIIDGIEYAIPGCGTACGAANDCCRVRGHLGDHINPTGYKWPGYKRK